MATKEASKGFDFKGIEKHTLTRPRDKAWTNWAKFEKVGDFVQGVVVDAFYRKAEGKFQAQRGITIEQEDGTLINVGVKRVPFVLSKTDRVHLGDPLKIALEEIAKPKEKGLSGVKIFGYYSPLLPENATKPTIAELDAEDAKLQSMAVDTTPSEKADEATDEGMDDFKPHEEKA